MRAASSNEQKTYWTMGNCTSSPALAEAINGTISTDVPVRPVMPPKASTVTKNGRVNTSSTVSSNRDDITTSALLHVLLPLILPIARQVVTKWLISDRMIHYKGEQMNFFDKDNMPIRPFDISIEHVAVVHADTLERDMKAMPDFEWPEAERYRSLMMKTSATGERKLVVIDVSGVKLEAKLAPGMDLSVSVEAPTGVSSNLEIGTGGSILQAKFYVEVPKVRVWFVTEPRYKVYVAFLARPIILPQVHIDVDRDRGELLQMEFKGETGGLNETIESILSAFGPSKLTQKVEKTKDTPIVDQTAAIPNTGDHNWIADALGRRISDALGTFALVGKERPLEIDWHESIQAAISATLLVDKPVRSVRDIEAEIEELEAKLEVAKEIQSLTQKEIAYAYHEEKKEDDLGSYFIREEEGTKATADVAPNCFFCGIGV